MLLLSETYPGGPRGGIFPCWCEAGLGGIYRWCRVPLLPVAGLDCTWGRGIAGRDGYCPGVFGCPACSDSAVRGPWVDPGLANVDCVLDRATDLSPLVGGPAGPDPCGVMRQATYLTILVCSLMAACLSSSSPSTLSALELLFSLTSLKNTSMCRRQVRS